MSNTDAALVAVPLLGLILVTLAVLITIGFAQAGRWQAARRTVALLCIYPGFVFVLYGVVVLTRGMTGAGPWVLFSTGLMMEAAGVRAHAWFAARNGSRRAGDG